MTYSKEIRISDEEMCLAHNPDTALAHAIAKSGIELPPMPWLAIAENYGNKQREEKWREAFIAADIAGFESITHDNETRESVYTLAMIKRIIT